MISLIAVGIAPSLALLCFFYLKDDFEQEPVYMVIRSFFFGALLVFPILFVQYALQEEGYVHSLFIEVFIQTAFIEEFLKWFIVLLIVYHHIDFNKRYDGIVYATAVSLGFASAENVLYLFVNGLETAFLRALFPVSSHALFGVVMGYYLGKAKFNPNRKVLYFSLAFVFPYMLHSLYNLILLTQNQWVYFLIPFMVFLWFLGLWKVKKANKKHETSFKNRVAS
ncbi:glutamic-type intramembrane protease PrsW [Evansella sp. AB-P1]|uniref:glutamic-type intramembrane protease PrsW n=1 Tax=Evansella sp. AB-P1 TaxID=3037653 RepID=UPI00241D6B34|nr:glutamic-type intramembrane protease PrsW [Evansella sp. AB-P1]MDG5787624.1 glutamic-type intramembrane protease PrsW [Evansella sp. AB-P1]